MNQWGKCANLGPAAELRYLTSSVLHFLESQTLVKYGRLGESALHRVSADDLRCASFQYRPGFMDSFSAQREMCKGSTETWCGLANWVEGLPHAVQTVPVPVSSETVTIVLSLAFIYHCSLLSKH